jgi:hypothetical protein
VKAIDFLFERRVGFAFDADTDDGLAQAAGLVGE